MNLVIMAAWEGSRMRPFTNTVPKPLLQICGKSIIEHNIEWIIQEFDEIFMVVKYKKESFISYFGSEYQWKQIHYIEQGDIQWTGAAILALDGKISGDFIVVSGDDLYDKNDILALIKQSGYATLCKRVHNPELFGIFNCDSTWKATGIIEKPTEAKYWNLANIGNHKFDDKIFDILKSIPLSVRGELEVTDLINIYIQQGIYSIVEAHGQWLSIGYPWDLLKVNESIIGSYTETIDKWSIIEPNVFIKWYIYLEEGVILKSGTYIEWNVYFGKWSVIWPNAYIRWNTSIGENSKVGSSVELKNSYVGSHTHIPHLSYIGDSVIGNNTNLWGGTKVANLRHDGKNIRVMVKNQLVDTGRHKLGAIIWDNVHTGIDTLIYPGRIISTDGTTLPGDIVK